MVGDQYIAGGNTFSKAFSVVFLAFLFLSRHFAIVYHRVHCHSLHTPSLFHFLSSLSLLQRLLFRYFQGPFLSSPLLPRAILPTVFPCNHVIVSPHSRVDGRLDGGHPARRNRQPAGPKSIVFRQHRVHSFRVVRLFYRHRLLPGGARHGRDPRVLGEWPNLNACALAAQGSMYM